jgi:uncharacterized membrane protein
MLLTATSKIFRGKVMTSSDRDAVARPVSRDAHTRSIVKAISWRIAGSIDTFVISFIITGHAMLAGSIAGTELITKILLYYLHERLWAAIPWGHRAK